MEIYTFKKPQSAPDPVGPNDADAYKTMRTAERYFILDNAIDLTIESIETVTERGTTYYQWVAYDFREVSESLHDEDEDRKEFLEDGAAAVMDAKFVFPSETFDGAINALFEYKHERGELDDFFVEN